MRHRYPVTLAGFPINATVLIALKEAEQIGVKPNSRTVERAIAATKRQQKADFSYLYGECVVFANDSKEHDSLDVLV